MALSFAETASETPLVELSDQEISQVLSDTQAIRSGHFKLTSGRHSDTYIQCARVLEHPRLTRRLAAETIRRLPAELSQSIDLVVSPAVGGILFGFAIADVLGTPMVFSERVEGRMALRRAFQIAFGSRVLIAEDVVTSGGSVREVADLIKAEGGQVLAVVALIDRGGEPLFQAPFYPLLRRQTPSWDAEDCKLCAQGLPLDAPGSRHLQQP